MNAELRARVLAACASHHDAPTSMDGASDSPLPTLTSDQRRGLPSFIIIGAMKAGTSALHHLLAHHPEVYIPPGEVFFFDVDDQEVHPDFFLGRGEDGVPPTLEQDLPRYLQWYRAQFQRARPHQRIGEDSTTYLASTLAPARIARLLPDAKLIALLRNPVSRAYSHYWHNVSRGRATMTFERALAERSRAYLSKGFYHEQILRYHAHLPACQLQVFFFEEFVANPQATVTAACRFLDIDPRFDIQTIPRFKNASHAPLHLPTRLLWNRLLQPLVRCRYRGRIPNTPGYSHQASARSLRRHPLVNRLSALLESARPERRPPPMRPEIRALLEEAYAPHNMRLSELLGRDVSKIWAQK